MAVIYPSWTPPRVRPRRRRRWLLLVGGVLVLLSPCLATVGFFLYQRHVAAQAVEEALAAADAQDPRWRLADIEKRRAAIPDKDNAARPVQDAAKLMPTNWPPQEAFEAIDILPPYQLDPALVPDLRAEIKKVQPVVAEARRAMKLQRGWVPIKWAPDYVSTNMEHVQKVRGVSAVLQLDAALRSQDGDHAGAWESSLNLFALCRAIDDEPTIISQLVRMAVRHMAANSLERTLAQGTVDDAALAEAHNLLKAEAEEPILVHAFRGERAVLDMLFTNLENGTVDVDKVLDILRVDTTYKLKFLAAGGSFKMDRAWMLNHCTQAIDIAKGPSWELGARLGALEKPSADIPPLARLLYPALRKVGEAYLRSKARLECAIAAIAVERYRLQFKEWPASLEQVVQAKLLDRIPTDAYDGRTLRFRKFDKGVVVYAVGLDGTYRGDILDGEPKIEQDQVRHEFRLWNPEHRRQPARPRPKEADGPGGGDGKN